MSTYKCSPIVTSRNKSTPPPQPSKNQENHFLSKGNQNFFSNGNNTKYCLSEAI